MKGFIEVKGQKDNVKRLINVRYIEEVENNLIYIAFNSPSRL